MDIVISNPIPISAADNQAAINAAIQAYIQAHGGHRFTVINLSSKDFAISNAGNLTDLPANSMFYKGNDDLFPFPQLDLKAVDGGTFDIVNLYNSDTGVNSTYEYSNAPGTVIAAGVIYRSVVETDLDGGPVVVVIKDPPGVGDGVVKFLNKRSVSINAQLYAGAPYDGSSALGSLILCPPGETVINVPYGQNCRFTTVDVLPSPHWVISTNDGQPTFDSDNPAMRTPTSIDYPLDIDAGYHVAFSSVVLT